MQRLVLSILTAAMFLAAPSLAWADAAGTAQGVKPAADALGSGQTRTLVVGADVFIGDVVKTGDAGQVQILFADNTELVVGPHSSLQIEDYLIRNDGSAGKLAVDMLAGSFRFATGDAAKNRYRIDTPTGTIGVRGTAFDVFVGNGVTRVLHYRGVVHLCTPSNQCADMGKLCMLGELSRTGVAALGDTRALPTDQRATLRRQFVFANNESGLLSRFREVQSYGCLHVPPSVPNTSTGDFGNGGPPPSRNPGRPPVDNNPDPPPVDNPGRPPVVDPTPLPPTRG